MFPHIPLNQSPIPGNRSVQLKKKRLRLIYLMIYLMESVYLVL